jgi:4,5-dihydroxyphthalate decarboxylase
VTLALRTAIGSYPHTEALKDGRVTSDKLVLEYVDVTPANRAFRPMVNQLAYDVSEMALVTLMLARAMGRPLRGIPLVLLKQSAHELLGIRIDAPSMDPPALMGRRIGVRAYTQTTGTWIRGILQHQYRVDLSQLQWLTFEDAHVDGFVDPQNCRRAPANVTLQSALAEGHVEAAIGLEPNPSWRPLLSDVKGAEVAFVRDTGVEPLNHVLVVQDDLAAEHPWLARELFELFEAAGAQPCGMEAIGPAVELLGQYATEQGILPRPPSVDELFEAIS